MKKSKQSSNDILAGGSIRRLFTVPMVICIVIFALILLSSVFIGTSNITSFDGASYDLFSVLKGEALRRLTQPNYTPYYYLTSGYSAPFNVALAGVVFAILQFNFLLSKKSCYTQLSFAVGRKQLYFNKVFFPVMIGASITVAVKALAAILNAYYLGFNLNLVIGLIVNIITTFAPFTEGYAIAVIAHMFTARKPEAYLLIASIMCLPTAISCVLGNIFSRTLYGYAPLSIYALPTPLNLGSYTVHFSDNFPIVGKTALFPELIFSTAVILISVLALVLCKIYFVNRFKAEQSGVRGKSRVALIISCVTFPLLFVNSYSLSVEYLSDNAYPFAPLFMVILISSAVLTVIFCLVVTWSPKKIRLGVTAAGIGIVLQIAVMVIGYTGGFGYAKRVPEAKDIESVNISLPFAEMGYMNEDNDFFNSGGTYGGAITLTNDYEFEIAHKIHEAAVNNRSKDTNIQLEVNYTLKNGQQLSRSYSNISETVLEEYMNLWEAQEVKERLGVLLNVLDSKKLYESKKAETATSGINHLWDDYYYEEAEFDYYSEYPSAIPLFTDTTIISKDYKVTKIHTFYDSTYADDYQSFKKEIMTALYKDACNLSAKEWFEPEKELGAISFDNVSTGYTGTITGNVFYVNSHMTNTLKVLDKYGYTKYFDAEKNVQKAHLADIDEVSLWLQGNYSYHYGEQEGHATYFSQNNSYIAEYLDDCGYCDKFDDTYDWSFDDSQDSTYLSNLSETKEAPFPKQEELTDLEAVQKMVDNAYMAYNVGNHGKFLVVKYYDGSCSMLVVPE